MIEALIIVHLCSLDSMIQFEGVNSARSLSTSIVAAIQRHHGPVIVMDQEWDEIREEAKQLKNDILSLNVIPFHHDELMDVNPWTDGMKRFASFLRARGVQKARLGGFWASRDASSGCVHETCRQLRYRHIPCQVDAPLCGFEA